MPQNANRTRPVRDVNISNAEYRNSIEMLAPNMTNQNNRDHSFMNENGGLIESRVRVFVLMNPPEFLRSQTNEDPQNSWMR